MADYVITVADVAAQTGATYGDGTAGASITQGDVIYIDADDSDKIKPADCTTSAATAAAKGVALNAAETGQPVRYAKAGSSIDFGTTFTIGAVIVLSTSGAIAPVADLTTADYVTIVGYATTASLATLTLDASGVQVP